MSREKISEVKTELLRVRETYKLPNINFDVMLSLSKDSAAKACNAFGVVASKLVYEELDEYGYVDSLLSAIVGFSKTKEDNTYFVNGVMRKQYLLDIFPTLATAIAAMDKKGIKNLSDSLVTLASKRHQI